MIWRSRNDDDDGDDDSDNDGDEDGDDMESTWWKTL